MKKNGFIASALLYGMLALFLTLMLTTLATLSNRKITLDKLKENALTSVEEGYASPESIKVIYDGMQKLYNEEGQTLWKDQSGHGYNGIVTGGENGDEKGLEISEGFVEVPITQKELGDNFTIIMTFTGSSYPINLWGTYNNEKGIGAEIVVDEGGTKKLNLYFCPDNEGEELDCKPQSIDIPSSIILTSPLQFALVVNEKNSAELYINGDKYETNPITGFTLELNTENLYIGKSIDNEESSFTGNIYNVLIYSDNLTENEIKHNYNLIKEKYGL